MSIAVTYTSKISVLETLAGPFVSPVDSGFTTDQLSTTETLTASTTVPVTKHADYEVTLSSGSATINFAALPGATADETINATGLKLQYAKLVNKSTNANLITVAKGGSNGYGLGASGASFTIPLSPGQEALLRGKDLNPDVASGARTWDVTGTGSQVLQVQLVFG